MAPLTFTLVSVGSQEDNIFLDQLKNLPASSRPLYVGKCQHWLHQPRLSSAALNGEGPHTQTWDYLVVTKDTDPFSHQAEKTWSITGDCGDEWLQALPEGNIRRAAAALTPLPPGWSPDDHSALDAAVPPPDLEASLGMSSQPMGSTITSAPIPLKEFVRTFGKRHTGPVSMFNLLSYFPDQRERYFRYIAAFSESVGSKYGAEPTLVGFNVQDWSSKVEEKAGGQEGEWEDTALVWYPSIWHFAKMVDDDEYMDVDRRYKQGALRDNPLICCTEIHF